MIIRTTKEISIELDSKDLKGDENWVLLNEIKKEIDELRTACKNTLERYGEEGDIPKYISKDINTDIQMNIRQSLLRFEGLIK